MAEETSLDVLSQAVSLVETEGRQVVDCRDSPSKELPTKELKYRRLRERRELSAVLPLRVWNKKCSPLQAQATDVNTGNGPESDSVSLSPSRSGENSPTVISSPTYCRSCLLHKANGTTPPPCNHRCFYKHITERLDQDVNCINLTVCDSDEDSDQPIDMSKKCTRQEEQSSSSQAQQQQQRPSVITCASALRRSQCHTKSDCQNAHCNGSSNKKHHSKSDSDDEDVRPGHRREVLSGMCDPVIDEHFRRSLGKDYPEFLSSNQASNVSITVDDHFAKALGETWLKLQQEKPNTVEGKSGSSNKIASHSPPSSPIRSHQQGVVSL